MAHRHLRPAFAIWDSGGMGCDVRLQIVQKKIDYLRDFLPQICDNIGMKLKTISRLLRLLAGRRHVADSDQHLQADYCATVTSNANAGRKTFDMTLRSEELGECAHSVEEVLNPYLPTPEKSKFERRMEAAKNPRQRKHKLRGKKSPFTRPATHLEARLDEMRMDERVFGRDCTRKFLPRRYDFNCQSGAEVLAKAGIGLVAAAVTDIGESIARGVRKKCEADEREARLAVRRKYYAAEQAKRDERSAAIRAAVPPPENKMPSAEELLDAYSRRHDSEEAKLRFGRLMIDLDEYVRCQVVREGARIVGTTGGVQKWLTHNCPELAKHYHTCQRFKRMVQEDRILAERCD